jgi:dynactin complex subunit
MELGIVKPVFHFESMLTRYFSLKTQKLQKKKLPIDLSPHESLVFSCFRKAKVCSLEYLTALTQSSPSSLLGIISLLELKQLIVQTSPGVYSVC